MVKQSKKQKRASPAHAQEDRIEFNGPNLGEPANGGSGNLGGNVDDSAGAPDGSMDVSGDVSSVNPTPAKSSLKKSAKSQSKSSRSRRGKVSRNLSEEFDSVKGLLDRGRDASGEEDDSDADRRPLIGAELPPVNDDSGNLVDLTQLDLQSEAGKALVLRYLTSDEVVKWMVQHDSIDALRTMIDGVRDDPLSIVALRSFDWVRGRGNKHKESECMFIWRQTPCHKSKRARAHGEQSKGKGPCAASSARGSLP